MKKFTDSEKWRDPWFRSLDLQTKTLWTFLLDEVDNAGIWELDVDYFQYATGIKKDLSELLSKLGDRVVLLPDERHLLVPKYCFYQQGGFLTESKPAHRRIFQLLQRHDLQQDEKGKLCHGNAIAMPSVCHANGINTGIGLGLGCIKKKEEGSVRGETISELPPELDDLSFLAVWDEWTSYRKERNLPAYKPLGLQAQRTRIRDWVSEHGMKPVIDSIRASIANNYNGLYLLSELKTTLNRKPEPDRDYDHALDL